MKKILIVTAFLFCAILSFAQTPYPNQGTGISNDSTLYWIKGGTRFSDGSVITNYIDTSSANLKHIAYSSGAMIFVNDTVWVRNIYHTKWIAILSNGTPIPFSDTVYVKPPLYVYIDSLGHQVIAIQMQDGLISGGIVTWDSLFVFDVSPATYVIGGQYYSSPFKTITLSPPDLTNPRYDLFVVDTTGRANVITGTPAPSPTVPQPTPGFQLPLTNGLIVNPGDTVPSNIQTTIIYDENIEWTTGAQHGVYTVDFNNTDNPYHLTKAIFLSKYNNTSLFFIDGSENQNSVNGTIDFWIYLNGAYKGNLYALFFDPGFSAANYLLINSDFGFNKNDSNQYQHIVIPYSKVTWLRPQFNQFQLFFNGTDTSGAKGLYVDYIRLQSGIPNIPQKQYQDSNTLVKTVVGSDTLNTINWLSNGIVHSLAPIYTHSGTVYTASNGLILQGNNIKIQDTLNGAGAKLIWVHAKYAFRVGRADGTEWDISNIGQYSFATGEATKASGLNSFANGYGTVASGNYSNASGSSDTASANYSNASGSLTVASGSGSNASGVQTVASNSYSNASGYLTTASGIGSYSSGYQTTASGLSSYSSGFQTTASGSHSSSHGLGTKSKSYAGSVLGLYNDSTNATSSVSYNLLNRVFQIGIGTSDTTRKNALTVLFNGNVKFDQYTGTNFYGTLAHRLGVDASGNVIQDTTSVGGGSGTVTNIAIGYGLSGGPITSTGTIIVDSAALSLKYLRIADTSAMLSPYKHKVDSIWRTPGVDSIKFSINGITYEILDSLGSGGSSLTRQVITSGTTATVTGGNYVVTFDPSSTIATFTLTMPASPSDLQTVEVAFGGTLTSGIIVTALTVSPNSGQTIIDNTPPGSATADNTLYYRYYTSKTAWQRIKL